MLNHSGDVAESIVAPAYSQRLHEIVHQFLESPADGEGGKDALRRQLKTARDKRPIAVSVLAEVLAGK